MKQKLKIIIPIGIAVIAIALAFVFIRFAPTKASVDIGTMISTAQQYLTDQKYEQAVAEFQKIIDIDPKNADAYIGLAKAYIGLGDTDKAVAVLEDGYDKTGDERIKALLDEIVPNEDESAETTVETTETSETTITEESEQDNALVSLIIPYTISDGYNYPGTIHNLICGDYWISQYEVNGTKYYNFYNGKYQPDYDIRSIQENDSFLMSIVGSSVGFEVQNENLFSGITNCDPFSDTPISIYRLDGTPISEVQKEYNADLQLIKLEYYNENGLYKTMEYEYDSNGFVISSKKMSENSESVTEYKYDLNGNIIEMIIDGNVYREYEYDEKGNVVIIKQASKNYLFEYHDNGVLSRYYYEGDDSNFEGEKFYSEIKYDESGNKVEWFSSSIIYSANGVYKRENVNAEYDEHGIQTRYTVTDAGGSIIRDTIYINSYDSSGRLISIIDDEDKLTSSSRQYEYDENGNLVKCIRDNYTESYTYDSENRILTETTMWNDGGSSTTEYEYDENGNTVKYGNTEVTEFVRVEIPKWFWDEVNK